MVKIAKNEADRKSSVKKTRNNFLKKTEKGVESGPSEKRKQPTHWEKGEKRNYRKNELKLGQFPSKNEKNAEK